MAWQTNSNIIAHRDHAVNTLVDQPASDSLNQLHYHRLSLPLFALYTCNKYAGAGANNCNTYRKW